MTTRANQIPLIKQPRKNTKLWWIVNQTTYGGALNYRKVARPFDSKKLVHSVLTAQLGSQLRFTRSTASVKKVIESAARRYDVKIKDLAVNHDHIHILSWTKIRKSHENFLKYIAAELGRKYAALKKKFGIRKKGSMWRYRPFTRLVGWHKKAINAVTNYIQKNRNEVLGLVEYIPRNHRLTQFLQDWNSRTSTA